MKLPPPPKAARFNAQDRKHGLFVEIDRHTLDNISNHKSQMHVPQTMRCQMPQPHCHTNSLAPAISMQCIQPPKKRNLSLHPKINTKDRKIKIKSDPGTLVQRDTAQSEPAKLCGGHEREHSLPVPQTRANAAPPRVYNGADTPAHHYINMEKIL